MTLSKLKKNRMENYFLMLGDTPIYNTSHNYSPYYGIYSCLFFDLILSYQYFVYTLVCTILRC